MSQSSSNSGSCKLQPIFEVPYLGEDFNSAFPLPNAHFETTGSDEDFEIVSSVPSSETLPTASSSTVTSDVSTTLAERGNRYGEFKGHAEVTQRLKGVVESELALRNKFLDPDQQEALDMIFHKIGRIVNGDPNYADSWHDIAGYAKLVDDRLNKEQAE
jgi:hypothetical protein